MPIPGAASHTPTSGSGSSKGSGLSSTPRTTLKMAVLAPMPSASVKTAISVNMGARSRRRTTRRGVAVMWTLYVCRSPPVRPASAGTLNLEP